MDRQDLDLGSRTNLPRGLLDICDYTVRYHARRVDSHWLAGRLWNKRDMFALAMIPKMGWVLKGAAGALKFQIILRIAIFMAVLAAWVVSWWILIVLPVLVAGERWAAKVKSDLVRFEASVVLGLEMLATDFLGWGAAFPYARARAVWLLSGDARPKIEPIWLDVFMPDRGGASDEELKQLIGPQRWGVAPPTSNPS